MGQTPWKYVSSRFSCLSEVLNEMPVFHKIHRGFLNADRLLLFTFALKTVKTVVLQIAFDLQMSYSNDDLS